MSEFCPKASQECRMRSSPAHCAVSECTGVCPLRSALSWGAGTYPAAAGRHGHHWGPLVGPGVVPLGTAELGGVVSAPHSIDHVLVHSAAQVLPPRPHRGDGVPPVLLRVVAFHCGEREAESASAGILSLALVCVMTTDTWREHRFSISNVTFASESERTLDTPTRVPSSGFTSSRGLVRGQGLE